MRRLGRLAYCRRCLGATPAPQASELYDLEDVDDVERRGEGDEPDRGGDHRPPRVPLAVLVRADEADRQCGGRERPAPRPDRQRGAPLREATAEEPVVQVRLVGGEDALAVLEPAQ